GRHRSRRRHDRVTTQRSRIPPIRIRTRSPAGTSSVHWNAARSTSPRPGAGSMPAVPGMLRPRKRPPGLRRPDRPMPDEALDRVLRLVADGHLTAAQAAPILDALEGRPRPDRPGPEAPAPDRSNDGPGRVLRIEVSDAGRAVMNLRARLSP